MRNADLLLAGLAAVIWGTIYLVTTEWLPQGYPELDGRQCLTAMCNWAFLRDANCIS